jgi:TonB family protein
MKTLIRLLAVLLLCIPALHADETKDLEKHMREKLLHQVLRIRNAYGDDHLSYDTQGNLLGNAQTDCPHAALLEVNKLEIQNNTLILHGPRMVGSYDHLKRAFSNLIRQSAELRIDIALNPAQMDEERVWSVLEKVFLTAQEDPGDVSRGAQKYSDLIPKAKQPDIVPKPGITSPGVLYSPDPVYPEEARRKKREGDVVLWAVIDEKGHPVNIRVAQCLGAGLDQAAVKAVSSWRFTPAKKNGRPVAVQLNIEITLHL